MVKTNLPNGDEVKLFPAPMETEFLTQNNHKIKCAPKLGENNESILSEIGMTHSDISHLQNEGII